MKRSHPSPTLTAERPELPDDERTAGLAELAERIVDPTWIDRETLAHIEQLTEDTQ